MNLWVLLAILFILGLMGIAAYYQFLLYRHRKKQAESAENFKNEIQKRRERGVESIVLISRAIIAGQVSLTEASIRINALSLLLMDRDLIEELIVFRQLSEATSHIPILDNWKKLPKQEKLAYDREREEIEAKFKDFVVATARRIVDDELLALRPLAGNIPQSPGEVVKEFRL